MMAVQCRQGRTPRNAVAVVESAIVIATCLLLLLAIFEYGRFVMLRHLVETAAREGARQAIANTATLTTADVQNTVTGLLAGQPIQVSTCNVYKADPATGASIGLWTEAGFGEAIAVEIKGSYVPILPGLGFLQKSVVMNAKVIMLSEAN